MMKSLSCDRVKWDVVVLGGGLAGLAAAAEAARAGMKTIVLERRAVPAWELCWAHAPSLAGGDGALYDGWMRRMQAAGGLRDLRADPAIAEITLDETVAELGFERLHHAQPVHLIVEDGLAVGAVAATKGGQVAAKGKTFVDATENGFFWQRHAPKAAASAINGSRFSIYLWVPESVKSGVALGNAGDARNICILPGVWDHAAELSFELDGNCISSARCLLPEVLRVARVSLPPDSIVTHTAPELLPVSVSRLSGETGKPHAAVKNLYGAGFWLESPQDSDAPAGSLLAWGARTGQNAAACQVSSGTESDISAAPVPVAPPGHRCDVFVAGAGTGGAHAALAAARRGHCVTLIEAGTAAGGIATMGGIHSYCVGLRGGLQDEVDALTAELTPLFGPPDKVKGFHPDAKKTALEVLLHEAGVDVRYGTLLVGAMSQQIGALAPAHTSPTPMQRVREAVVASSEGSAVWSAKVFVDGTGDADLAAWAGARTTFGRATDGLPHAYSLSCGRVCDGSMQIVNFDAGYVDPTDPHDMTRGRRDALKLHRRKRFTESDRPTYIAPLLGLRSSRQVLCDAMLTLPHQVSGTRHPDVIAETIGFYDNHGYDYEFESDLSMFYVWVLGYWSKRLGYEIPYGALLPRGLEGLLVACRACGLTHDAHMSFRMQNDIQRIGEAAGLAAALAVEADCTPRAIEVRKLQEALIASGALRPAGEKPRFLEKLEEIAPGRPALPSPDRTEDLMSELSGEHSSAALLTAAGARHGSPSSAELAEAAASEVPALRFRAAAALSMRNDSAAIPALLRAVEERDTTLPSPDVARKVRADVPAWIPAMLFLGRLRAREAVPAVSAVLEDRAAGLDALLAALRTLGRIGDPIAADAVDRFMKRTDVDAGRRLQNSSAGTPVILDARWQIDLAAAETMADLSQPRPQWVEPYLNDEQVIVRRRAETIARRIEEIPVAL